MKKWMVLTTLSASMFIIVIDTTVMNVSISALIDDLGATVGGIQAAIALYALVMAAFMLIGGKLADVIGKKRTFMIGVGIFGVGTFMASASQSILFIPTTAKDSFLK
jgi:MFS family permease